MNNIKMLYHDRVGFSEGIDVNKTGKSKQHDICHYLYFLDEVFKFQLHVCNRYHSISNDGYGPQRYCYFKH